MRRGRTKLVKRYAIDCTEINEEDFHYNITQGYKWRKVSSSRKEHCRGALRKKIEKDSNKNEKMTGASKRKNSAGVQTVQKRVRSETPFNETSKHTTANESARKKIAKNILNVLAKIGGNRDRKGTTKTETDT